MKAPSVVKRLLRTRRSESCAHPETVTTTNFGLRRTSCLFCGEVTMDRLAPAGSGTLFAAGGDADGLRSSIVD